MEQNGGSVRRRMDVGVLGATGMVGQQFVTQLANHPWFRPAWLGASERSEGRAYRQAASWRLPEDPPAEIIELSPPQWHEARGELPDPLGGAVHGEPGGCRFDDGTRVEMRDGVTRIAFSPAGRWFAACSGKRGVLLWDRQRDRRHRLRGWQLCGWYREQPWLSRREGTMPLALAAVLGHDADEPPDPPHTP